MIPIGGSDLSVNANPCICVIHEDISRKVVDSNPGASKLFFSGEMSLKVHLPFVEFKHFTSVGYFMHQLSHE